MDGGELGWKGRLSYRVGRAAALIPGVHYHRYLILSQAAARLPAMPRGYSAGPVTPERLAGRIDAAPEVISYRKAQGLVPIAAERGDSLLGVVWLTAAPFDEDEVRVRWVPPPGHAWDTGLWIDPRHRMTRAFATLWAGAGLWLAGQGLRGSASRIADYNRTSLAPHLRLGAEILGSVVAAGLGPVQIATKSADRFTLSRRATIEVAKL
ncbi:MULTISPECIES: hypothetical protein [Pacificimonas]|uniref:Uncharacterized protein n=1 Tax=Pacificimonas aurantium TaxID=1250540 RepID=A0ABS7WNM6_9SPHN|nr:MULTISPECIES: hypothetical protein [Pacificimonas]MBZ6380007.1 hypothetical protein [Pacificimonas aurantium]